MKLSVSDDKYEAYLHPEMGEPGTQIPIESLRQYLASNGITDTVIVEPLEKIAADGLPSEDVLVATGFRPEKGKDGFVEHVFKIPKPIPESEKDKEKEQHPCLLEIYNVRSGEVISILHPPGAGTPGKTVFGVPVPSQPGKASRLRVGENVHLSEDKASIIATVDGGARVAIDGIVSVEPVLRLKEDVGPLTGSITFFGDVVVLGGVKSEYWLKAERSIEIKGGVGDAIIEAGMDVTVTEGYVGTGKGIIRSEGTVRLKFVHHQQVIAKHDIYIEREAIDAKLHTKGKIIGARAVFIGGTLEADGEIDAMDLGNGDETNLTAHVGNRPKLLEKLNELDKRRQQVEKQLTDVKAAAYKLVRIQLDNGKLTPDQLTLMGKLKVVQDALPKELASNEEEQKAIRESLQNSTAARINVRGTISANALIDINGIKKMVQEPLQGVIFIEKQGRIEQAGT